MIGYLLRRFVYGVSVLLGVNFLTFVLFFAVNTPDDMARLNLGGRYVTSEAVADWKTAHGYDQPLFYNVAEKGTGKITKTLFWSKSVPLLTGDLGMTDAGRSINEDVRERAPASLALAIPTFVLGVAVMLVFSLLLVWVRRTGWETAGVVTSIGIMSVSSLFYIILGQWLFAKTLRWVPVSGFADGIGMVHFLLLPVAIALFSRLGGDALLYRALFLEEIGKDYVRTARAKGAGELQVLFGHVLRNAMLPILTSTVAAIPMLFMGSLIMENFFGIPGLGAYTIDAINAQDFSVVRSMVFLGTAAYVAGLILTDFAYAAADPRIRLQ